MAKKIQKNPPEVRFITSVALAAPDMDGVVQHFQISICQDVESKSFRAFFDVVDPSKVKLQDGVS